MFTGLVEEVGNVRSIAKGSSSTVLTIACETVLDQGTKIGDSIAVNGVCLTVTRISGKSYCADVMNETLRRSNLGDLKNGDLVNLERAMPANGRFGGHIVSGHIDGTGRITQIEEDANAVWYTVTTEEALLRYIVEKGSITIDGISLTVAQVGETSFRVSTIPHTREVTTLSVKKEGSVVNLECDIIGKYVEKLLLGKNTSGTGMKENTKSERISEQFLLENGFL